MNIAERIASTEKLLKKTIEIDDAWILLGLLEGQSVFPRDVLLDFRLYSEYLPRVDDFPYTKEQRLLHLIWEIFDRLPLSIAANFAIPFRRMLAKKIFKKCGKNFSCEEGVRFNFPQNIEIGDDVFFNRGVFLDSKGGIIIGNYTALAEGVEIYTHGHSEARHQERSYAPVVIKDYAKIYAQAMILPGVTVGKYALVGGKAVVNKDVQEDMLVAGIPAAEIRRRGRNGLEEDELEHIWLKDAAFQGE